MQLRTARLCLDCEEIHETQECPVCLSEAGIYVSRWIPAEERRRAGRFPTATNVVPIKSGVVRWMQRGVVGLAVIAAGRWWWRANHETDPPPQSTVPQKPEV